jgi:steroid delta-isomerase-like uncharacterized protein
MLKDKESVIRRLIDVVNSGDLDPLDEILSPDMVYRTSGYPEIHGIDEMKAFLDSGRTAFPDGRITIDRVVTGGDMVTYHYTFTGTHRGEWFGIPPTGRRISIATISMDRVVDGKIVESVEVSDNLDFLQQLGIIEKDIVPEAQF